MYKKYKSTLIILIMLIISGCGINLERLNPLTSPPPPPKKIKIGVSISTMEVDFFKIIKEAIIKNKKQEHITIIWKNADNKLKKQKQDVKELVEQKVDIIIYNPVDTGKNGVEIIKLAKESNIPIVAMDRMPKTKLSAYVSADNFKVGQLQARYLSDQINKEGKVVILKGDKNTNTAQDITAGNKSELKKYKKIKIIKEKWHRNWSKKLATKTVKNILKQEKDIKGILANNDNLALGAIKALKEEKLNDKVIVIGGDANKEATIAIAKEELNATVDKMPYLIGLNSLKVAGFIARNEKWNWDREIKIDDEKIKLITTPVKLITKYNIETLEDRWGKLPIKNKKINKKEE